MDQYMNGGLKNFMSEINCRKYDYAAISIII